jgi:hypothetical protein
MNGSGITPLTILLKQKYRSLGNAADQLGIKRHLVYRDCDGTTQTVPQDRRDLYAKALGRDLFSNAHRPEVDQAIERLCDWLHSSTGRTVFKTIYPILTGKLI